MKTGGEGFQATDAAVQATFDATATCVNPDVYDSKVFYDPTSPDFSWRIDITAKGLQLQLFLLDSAKRLTNKTQICLYSCLGMNDLNFVASGMMIPFW